MATTGPKDSVDMGWKSKDAHLAAAMAVASSAALYFGWRAWWRHRHCGNPRVPEPAKPVDLSRYLGKWYELARYENRFERGCQGVTAEYVARPDGLIDVINSCELELGERKVSRGRAKVVPDSADAKLKVSFFGPFYVGDYWVMDHDDDYQWTIVGEPSGCYLWILHREATPDPALINHLRGRAAAMGYDVSRLYRTRHGHS